MVDVLPRQLGDVDEAVHATEVDEGAEVDDRGDDALADLARLQVGQELVALLLLGLLEPRTPGEHDVVAVLVELDDLRLERTADVGLEVPDAAQLDERRRQEATQADVEDEPALDDLDDRAVDDAVVLLRLLDRAPGALVLGALLGQDEPALLVLLLEDEGLDVVADADDLVGVDVVADRELTGGDDALGLEADVEQDLVLVDLDHRALRRCRRPRTRRSSSRSRRRTRRSRGRPRSPGAACRCRLRRRCRTSRALRPWPWPSRSRRPTRRGCWSWGRT